MPDLLPRLRTALAGRYTVDRELGRGGTATVYLAEDLKHGRRVAIKVLGPELAAVLGRDRFLREIRLTARLNHPHILPLLDSGDASGLLYYVMPYVDGESLRDRLRREHRLPVPDALVLAGELADALSYAHGQGLVHRDVKPENVLLSAGHGLLSDFGIARVAGAPGGEALTQPGIAVGTPAYMSPEQVAGEQDLDGRSDTFSLGCVVYEMLAGEPPFTGPSAQAVIARRFSGPPPQLTDRRPDVPSHVARALARALAFEPADRFDSPLAFARALSDPGAARPVAAAAPSIAVLPFANVGGDPDEEYFGDGVAEEILDALARLPHLQVAARTSSFAFKGRSADLAEIGAKLRVATVLEGSVRKAGTRVRIAARLVDVASGYQLWSERYDRELGDIFTIQDTVARTIAQRLEVALGAAGRLVRPPTRNLDAYQLYLKGRYIWNQRGPSLGRALEAFQRALVLDPDFAQAHAGVADACALLAFYGVRPPGEVMPRAKAAARRALDLDDRLAEAHSSMGIVSWLYDWDWAAAERELQRAIELNPRYPVARHWYGALKATKLQVDEAIALDQEALALEPLSTFANLQLGIALLVRGREEEAIAQLRTTLELDPHAVMAHWALGCAHATRGQHSDALVQLRAAVDLSNRMPSMVASLAGAHAEAGQFAEARGLLAELQQRAGREYVPGLALATVLGALGQTEEALGWLDRARQERDAGLPFLRDRIHTAAGFSMPAAVRSDPRYHALLRTIGVT